MEHIAHEIVKDYIIEHLDKSDDIPQFEVYTVWNAKLYRIGSSSYQAHF